MSHLIRVLLSLLLAVLACACTFQRAIRAQDDKIQTLQRLREVNEGQLENIQRQTSQDLKHLNARLENVDYGIAKLLSDLPFSSSGRDFLVRGRIETPGYGLYSYLLIQRPSESAQTRQSAALAAFVRRRLINEMEHWSHSTEGHSHLNITYLPLVSVPDEPTDVDKLLHLYDYDRAEQALEAIGIKGSGGIYLAVSDRPLPLHRARNRTYIIWELSGMNEYLLQPSIEEFVYRMAHERSWGKDKITHLFPRLSSWAAMVIDAMGDPPSMIRKFVTIRRT